MNGESVNKVDSGACHQEETEQKKPWQAPVMEVLGLVRETEAGAVMGSDGIVGADS